MQSERNETGEIEMATYAFDEASAFFGPLASLDDSAARVFFELVCMSRPNHLMLWRIKGRPIDREIADLEKSGLIRVGENGNVLILKIASRSTSNERVKKHRENKALQGSDKICGADVNTSFAKEIDVTPSPVADPVETVENGAEDESIRIKAVIKKDPIPYQTIVEMFNERCTELPKCVMLNAGRKTAIKERWSDAARLAQSKDVDCLVEFFQMYFDRINGSHFLTGKNDRGWRASFDFVFKAKSFATIMEKGYGCGGK